MMSQLDGLVQALQKKQRSQMGVMAVCSMDSGRALSIAQLLAQDKRVLLVRVAPHPSEKGSADWLGLLRGEECALVPMPGTTLFCLESHGDFEFPAWLTGETARRLLEWIFSPSQTWDHVVLDLGGALNEGCLLLAEAAESIFMDISSAPWDLSNQFKLVQIQNERNAHATFCFSLPFLCDESFALGVVKELNHAVGHRSLRIFRNPESVVEWVSTLRQAGIQEES